MGVLFRISIHASHAGCDQLVVKFCFISSISIHASHAGCDDYLSQGGSTAEWISIHASHAGCDGAAPYTWRLQQISIHASHAGCDRKGQTWLVKLKVFQSTHPMRDATSISSISAWDLCGFQSTHPMRDATTRSAYIKQAVFISIHASHAGCDQRLGVIKLRISRFQSTHPMRDATPLYSYKSAFIQISIHASHAGCDIRSSLR